MLQMFPKRIQKFNLIVSIVHVIEKDDWAIFCFQDLLKEAIPVTAVWKKDSWSKRGVQVPEGEVKTAMAFDILPGKQRLSHSALTAEIHYAGAAVPFEMLTCCGLYFFFIFFDSLHYAHLVISRVDFASLYHAN